MKDDEYYKWLGIGIVAIVMVVMFAGCIEEHPSAPAAMPTPTPGLFLGESEIVDDFSFTVVRFEESYECDLGGSGTTKTVYPKEGTRFLWIYIRAENVGESAKKIPRMAKLQYIKGSTIGAICSNKSISHWTPINRKMFDGDKEIYPNVVEEGWVLFEVPKGIDISQTEIRICPKKGYPCMAWSLAS